MTHSLLFVLRLTWSSIDADPRAITTTPVLVPGGDAPSTFVVGSDRVFIRPPNDATGFVVRDGKLPVELPRSLQRTYLMLPGPDQQHLWINPTTGDTSGLALVNLDGKPTGITIDGADNAAVLGSDGAGYPLLTSTGGMYDARPGSVARAWAPRKRPFSAKTATKTTNARPL